MLDRFASEQMIGLTSECVIAVPRNIQPFLRSSCAPPRRLLSNLRPSLFRRFDAEGFLPLSALTCPEQHIIVWGLRAGWVGPQCNPSHLDGSNGVRCAYNWKCRCASISS